MEQINEQEVLNSINEVVSLFKTDSDLNKHLIRSGYLMHGVATVLRTVGLSDSEMLKRIKKHAYEHLLDLYINVDKKNEEEVNSSWFKNTFLIKTD